KRTSSRLLEALLRWGSTCTREKLWLIENIADGLPRHALPRFLRLTVLRRETCCCGFCTPPRSFSEIQGRCGLLSQRTTARPAPQERKRNNRAFQPPHGSCD